MTLPLTAYTYECAPEKCGRQNCCAQFDVAVTAAEQARLTALLPALTTYCAWLADESPFANSPVFCFIKKRDGLCVFNYRGVANDAPTSNNEAAANNERYYCALHSWALAHKKNPYQIKPRGCAGWPLLEDGAGNLTLDVTAKFPCLRRKEIVDEKIDPQLAVLYAQMTGDKKVQTEN